MQHAYRSFHEVLAAAWGTVAPGVPMEIDSPDDADALPPECLRVFWQDYAIPTDQANRWEALIDVAVRVPPPSNSTKPNTLLALTRAAAIDLAMGFRDTNYTGSLATPGGVGGAGYGRLGRFDWTVSPIRYLTEMKVVAEQGWIAIPTKSPGQLHVARTIKLQYLT